MSWSEPGEERWEDRDGDADEGLSLRWPLHWRELYPHERWIWFEQVWSEVCSLRERYRLAIRSGWWENEIQLEALAALSAWVCRYDSGEWDDPPGKLALLYDLERVSALLRDGVDPFNPDRDRPRFVQHLIELGCQPSPASDHLEPDGYHPEPDGYHPEPDTCHPDQDGRDPPS
jgi:hypothetical protein